MQISMNYPLNGFILWIRLNSMTPPLFGFLRRCRPPLAHRVVLDEVDVHLREGHFDPRLIKGGLDGFAQLAAGFRGADDLLVHPEVERKFQRAVAEIGEEHPGRRRRQDLRVGRDHFERRLLDEFHGRAVAGRKVDAAAEQRVGKAPVDHLVIQQLAVGHDDFALVKGAYQRGAHAQVHYGAADAAHFDGVAQPERAVQREDDAADQVVEHVLSAKTDGDGHGAAEEREGRQGDVHDAERRQEDDNDQQIEHKAVQGPAAGLVDFEMAGGQP